VPPIGESVWLVPGDWEVAGLKGMSPQSVGLSRWPSSPFGSGDSTRWDPARKAADGGAGVTVSYSFPGASSSCESAWRIVL
jgi:hypothetical protein